MPQILVVFDLDGTLFRTETVDIEAINKALTANGYDKRNDQEILSYIGMTLNDISSKLLNTNDASIIEKFRSDVIRNETDEIRENGKLYDGALESLTELSNLDVDLCICTNGNERYVLEIAEKFNLGTFFRVISYNNSILTKSERVGELKKNFNANTLVMVGDRTSDIQAARDNQGISIGVSYGFGGREVLEADYIANDIQEVVSIIKKIHNDCIKSENKFI